MALKRIALRNFRSFSDVDIELKQYNVVIGSNAAGKTNLLNAFRFLRDALIHGIGNSLSMYGGDEFFRNVNLPPNSPSSLKVVFDDEHYLPWAESPQSNIARYAVMIDYAEYEISIQYDNLSKHPEIANYQETIKYIGNIYKDDKAASFTEEISRAKYRPSSLEEIIGPCSIRHYKSNQVNRSD